MRDWALCLIYFFDSLKLPLLTDQVISFRKKILYKWENISYPYFYLVAKKESVNESFGLRGSGGGQYHLAPVKTLSSPFPKKKRKALHLLFLTSISNIQSFFSRIADNSFLAWALLFLRLKELSHAISNSNLSK